MNRYFMLKNIMFDDFFDDEEFEAEEGDSSAANLSALSLPPPSQNPDLFGHEMVEQQLLDLYNTGKLPHAMIFAGGMGIGKATCAFRLARFLLSQPVQEEAGLFGEDKPTLVTTLTTSPDHPAFKKIAAGGHPDLRYFERALSTTGAKKTVFDVDTVRKIAPFLRMSASEGGWRIVIVDEADLMNKEAQNAILKILEEPPPQSLLILICDRLGAMIPTIRSRCRTFSFSPLDHKIMETLLMRAAPQTSSRDIKILAELANGSIGRAMQLEEDKGVNTLNSILAFLSEWPDWKWSGIHHMADTLGRKESARAYAGFTHIMEWVAQSCAKSCAVNGGGLPETLQMAGLDPLLAHYSLGQWIEICEKLSAHFTAVEQSNLDERQGVIGAFSIFGGN